MISVLILGQGRVLDIARLLNCYAADIRARFIPPGSYARLLAAPPRSERVLIMRVGYRIGAATPRGRLFDAYWSLLRRSLPGAARCHYWLGTDVLRTIEEAEAGALRWSEVSSTRGDLHLSVAPWLTRELEAVGLHATTVLLPTPFQAPKVAPPMPAEFNILTYLPTRRFDFYGGQTILEAARRLPSVRFDVVASGGESVRSAPANVHWHGWVPNMAQRYAQTTVVVRIPRHDGYGNTVIEGLLNARHVVYTQDVPFVRRALPPTAEGLVAVLEELRDAHAAGLLGPNLAGREYALEKFDEAHLGDQLAAVVRARV